MTSGLRYPDGPFVPARTCEPSCWRAFAWPDISVKRTQIRFLRNHAVGLIAIVRSLIDDTQNVQACTELHVFPDDYRRFTANPNSRALGFSPILSLAGRCPKRLGGCSDAVEPQSHSTSRHFRSSVTWSPMAATHWAAAMLGHQPALGAPWLRFGSVSIYAPWKLFTWCIAFDTQAPRVFHRAGLLALFGGIAPALIAIGGAAWRSRAQGFKTTYGSARWADLSDIGAAGLLSPRGVVLGAFQNTYLRHDGAEHVLAVAPTRSGKGVGLAVPTLLNWTGSAIIYDLQRGHRQLTAG